MNTEQRKANEKYYFQMMKMKPEYYIWKDTGNIYDMSSGIKIKPHTLKGYVELSATVRKPFMKMFVELPSDCPMPEEVVWGIIDDIEASPTKG